jgi:N-acetylneuraminic acid mutarotase
MGNLAKILVLLLLFLTAASSITILKPVSGTDSISDNTWITKASMNQARAYLGVALVNDKIYAIGGDKSTVMGNVMPGTGVSYLLVSVNEEYNPENDSWIMKTPMPTSRACFGTAVYQNKIYCIGGYTRNVLENQSSHDSALNQVYDPQTDSWSTKASLPVPLNFVQASTIGDKIYVTSYLSSSVYIYDPIKDSWSTGNPAPFDIRSVGSAAIANTIYTIGQDWSEYKYPTNTVVKTYVQAYNTLNNSWSIVGNSSARDSSDNGVGATVGSVSPSRIYFFENRYGNSSDFAMTKIYDPSNNSWADGAPMPSNRLCAGVVLVNDTFYVIGGRSGQWGYITIEYPSALTEQYFPVGYGNIQPTISFISPLEQIYNESSVSIMFTVDKPVSWVEYSLDGKANVTTPENLTLSGLSNGMHNLTLYAKYSMGTVGASKTINFKVSTPEDLANAVVPILFLAPIVLVATAVSLLLYRKHRRSKKT